MSCFSKSVALELSSGLPYDPVKLSTQIPANQLLHGFPSWFELFNLKPAHCDHANQRNQSCDCKLKKSHHHQLGCSHPPSASIVCISKTMKVMVATLRLLLVSFISNTVHMPWSAWSGTVSMFSMYSR